MGKDKANQDNANTPRGKVIELLNCNYCHRAVTKKAVRNMGFFEIVLCNACYERYVLAMRPEVPRWPRQPSPSDNKKKP